MSFVQCSEGVHWIRQRRPAASGHGTSVVFLNALGTDHRIWDGVAERLPRELGVVQLDQRGHGLSELGQTPYRIEALAADVADVVQQLGTGPVIACGLSVGGLVAQALAIEHPECVAAACLCGTALRIGSEPAWRERIALVERDGLEAVAQGVVDRWFSPGFATRHPEIVRGCLTMLRRAPRAGYLATVAALAEADFTSRARQLRAPTLVVSAGLDEATPAGQGRALAEAVCDARFELLPEAAHLFSVEEPQRLAELIERFAREQSLV